MSTIAQSTSRPATEPGPITIRRTDDGHRLECSLWLPRAIADVFEFFSRAENLEELTPSFLRFRIVSAPQEMRDGAIIRYRLKVRGVPIGWTTRIAAWDPPHRFIDQALRSPYRKWIHEHTFTPVDGGTLCRDVVDYAVPGGPLGPLVHALLVKRELRKIFTFRQEEMIRRFG